METNINTGGLKTMTSKEIAAKYRGKKEIYK